ncbi:tRNA dihydrouridine(20/20a) synthase DusA [Mesopusillimonas faecipullorum]|nr:tRNA dihydrouridine(20/20a) synthase DusA [Mesopusillimonas faecipullorum]
MIDVTDRHCRYFHRLLAPEARLYTEMVTTGALLHGNVARHLDYDDSQHPVALQLGGSDPAALAASAKLAQQWGYDEVNLNCGCPSDRVQKGAFGACLMADPQLVAQAWRAMQEAVDIPVTIKHRLGLGYDISYGFARDFVGELYQAGCKVFIVHARNAVLEGLSPKDNREIPPLRYDLALQLKRDFPDAQFVLNGGIATAEQAQEWLGEFDGVMLGRAAWHHPEVLSQLAHRLQPQAPVLTPEQVIQKMMDYAREHIAQGTPLRMLTRPMLGWMGGRPGARRWRRMLSDARLLATNDPAIIEQAWKLSQPQAPVHPQANPEYTP